MTKVTKKDVGKICVFWDNFPKEMFNIGILSCISTVYTTKNGKLVKEDEPRYMLNGLSFPHCRRLTKTEIQELC